MVINDMDRNKIEKRNRESEWHRRVSGVRTARENVTEEVKPQAMRSSERRAFLPG